MAHKQHQLHELLKEDQEPFHLQNHIANRRSQFKNSFNQSTLQLKKRRDIISKTSVKRVNLCKHTCFLSFQDSPDVRKSPFIDFKSPAMSPCKSPNGAVFLHIPSKTAAVLAEAATRIQKQQQQSKLKSNVGFGLLGSFLKRLKDRSKNKKRVIENNDIKIEKKLHERIEEENVDSNRVSTSSCCSEMYSDFGYGATRFSTSPFRFSLHNSPSSTGRLTPELCSPVVSPNRQLKQDQTRDSKNVEGEEEKEQCSPVSVLDPLFQEDDEHESEDNEEEDHDYELESCYANVQRVKQQLLNRLRRFEKLAELDPIELESNLLEGSDSDQMEYSENDDPLSPNNNESVETTKVFNYSSIQHCPKKMPTNRDIICSSDIERISSRFDFLREVEFESIDMMTDLDFKTEFNGWKKIVHQGEDTVAEIELAVFGRLMEELSEELIYMVVHH